MRILYKAFVFLIFATVASCLLAGFLFFNFVHSPLPVQTDTVFVVPKGASTTKIAHEMFRHGIIKYPAWFLLWVRANNAWGKLKAGEYLIKKGSLPLEVIQQFVEARVIQHPLTIVEGWNFHQLMSVINLAPKLEHTLMGLTEAEIMAKIGHPGEHPEGRFYPETYLFPAETLDIAFLQRAYAALEKKLDVVWANRDPNLPLKTKYEALILASIIEKESSLEEEYTEIAGVYVRRLLRKMPLQADPTVVYGLKENYPGKLSKDLLTKHTPYNTYLNTGLPPTPIAMPSQKALYAATHPKPGNTLYFVAKGDKKGHVFSRTLEEHNAAVSEYRKTKTNNTNLN